ncbi:MAG: pantoate--beta-alanine ligase [Solirubrobacterales bacterium]|nr:pantoate--beta-alanine ligase [Solirubrobacterales bacterium]MBV9164957.1 pantoate--beta-alanine ligase [Solirubrobacterales bacterium]
MPENDPELGQEGKGAAVETVRTVAEIRAVVRQARRRGQRVALVPTMGAFHAGHLSLMRRARAECDLVVVSLFVNPTQFNDSADLDAYPRDERRDALLATRAGVDVLFAPPPEEIYTDGFATRVAVGEIGMRLEGAHRGTEHFEGVATIVVKLLNIVSPDAAYFGQKDAQQAAVIRRLVRDLDIDVSVEVCPTVRAPDGLALSSRIVHLSPRDRGRATALHRSLTAAERLIAYGERNPAVVAAAAVRELRQEGIDPDYFELVEPETFKPLHLLEGDVLAVVAATVGSTRLIDNLQIHVPSAPTRARHNNIVAADARALRRPARPAA